MTLYALTITSDATYVHIEFNDLISVAGFEVSCWRKDSIQLVCITKEDVVSIRAENAINDYILTAASVSRLGATPVYSVNGIVPTTNRELLTLLLDAGR
jgi:hypothetical protein